MTKSIKVSVMLAFALFVFQPALAATTKVKKSGAQITGKGKITKRAKSYATKPVPKNQKSYGKMAPVKGQLLVMDNKGKSAGVFPAYAIDKNHIAVRFNENLPPLTLARYKFRANFGGKRSFYDLQALDSRINLAILGTKQAIAKVRPGYVLSSINPNGHRELEMIWPRLVRLQYPDGGRLPSSSQPASTVIHQSVTRAQSEIFAELSQGTKAVHAMGQRFASVPEDSACGPVTGSKGTLSLTSAESIGCRSSVTSKLAPNIGLFWTAESGVYSFNTSSGQPVPDLASINNLVGSKSFDDLRTSETNQKDRIVCNNYSVSNGTGHASFCTRPMTNAGDVFDTVVVMSHQEADQQVKYSVVRLSGMNIEYTQKTVNTFLADVIPSHGGF